MRAGVMSGEDDVLVSAARRWVSGRSVVGLFFPGAGLFNSDDDVAFRQVHRLLDGFRQTRPHLAVDLQAIDDDCDIVLDAAIEVQVVGQAHDLAIDASAQIAALQHVLK